jgi:hypothetical protein
LARVLSRAFCLFDAIVAALARQAAAGAYAMEAAADPAPETAWQP